MRRLWQEFQAFKSSARYRDVGFSKDPYQAWMGRLRQLRDHATYPSQLMMVCGVTPGELIEVALDYQKGRPAPHGQALERSFASCFKE